ncbi:MAG: F0F1 ATP synthase subunit epsilon [Candidatus Omnitrophota bacterium]|nr:F0F1 ATP synthase subunit epsilon [Candidatus Omnitrophota bacterium]
MAKPFNLTILSPEKVVYEGRAVSLVVPSESGFMGVLADHAPLIANLRSGRITVKKESGDREIFNSDRNGFIEVLKNNVTVLIASGVG